MVILNNGISPGLSPNSNQELRAGDEPHPAYVLDSCSTSPFWLWLLIYMQQAEITGFEVQQFRLPCRADRVERVLRRFGKLGQPSIPVRVNENYTRDHVWVTAGAGC
jgi:hypothetical protein